MLRPTLRSVAQAAVFAAGIAASLQAQAQTPRRTPPRLVVQITVDQMRPDYLERWRAQMTGGLRRLMDEGAFFPRGVHDHAITETAPGHASILSGRFPYSTGIALNDAGVGTTDYPMVGATGPGAAPFRFIGTTLADWMTAADPRTKVLSVSRKDRSAILPIGRAKHAVYWYAQSAGAFVTSSWYSESLPPWVRAYNAEHRVLTRYAGRSWTLLLDRSAYPEPDSERAESAGVDFLFPHALSADAATAHSAIIGLPWMDEFILDFAWRGVRELGLGAGPQTDLLAVSLSTTDAVGHRYGPDSRELHDQVLRLDRYLGAFIDSLVALRGRDAVVIALTSDHGVSPVPEVRSTFEDNRGAFRFYRDAFDPAFTAVSPTLATAGIPADAFGFDGQILTVDRTKAFGKERALRGFARAFAAEARKVKGVLRVDVIDDLARADTVKDAIARRWLHTFRPGGVGLVAITQRPFHYLEQNNVASHGTPHDYDARVPIIFWGAPFVTKRDTTETRVVDIAPTLATLLGISPLERLDGRTLPRALRTPAP